MSRVNVGGGLSGYSHPLSGLLSPHGLVGGKKVGQGSCGAPTGKGIDWGSMRRASRSWGTSWGCLVDLAICHTSSGLSGYSWIGRAKGFAVQSNYIYSTFTECLCVPGTSQGLVAARGAALAWGPAHKQLLSEERKQIPGSLHQP